MADERGAGARDGALAPFERVDERLDRTQDRRVAQCDARLVAQGAQHLAKLGRRRASGQRYLESLRRIGHGGEAAQESGGYILGTAREQRIQQLFTPWVDRCQSLLSEH